MATAQLPSGRAATDRPGRALSGASTVAQALAFVAFVGGLYLLAGIAWTLVIVSPLVFIGSVAVEWLAGRTGRA